MKKSELKEMIKAAFLAEKADGDVVDPYMAEGEEDLDELLARLSEETELDEIDDFEANANRIMAKNKDLADKKSAVKQAEEDYKAGKISNEEFAKIIQNNQYINKESVDESFEKLVSKLEKQGKSKKAAKAIAGAVASYKAKGGGKGPTKKQQAR